MTIQPKDMVPGRWYQARLDLPIGWAQPFLVDGVSNYRGTIVAVSGFSLFVSTDPTNPHPFTPREYRECTPDGKPIHNAVSTAIIASSSGLVDRTYSRGVDGTTGGPSGLQWL